MCSKPTNTHASQKIDLKVFYLIPYILYICISIKKKVSLGEYFKDECLSQILKGK